MHLLPVGAGHVDDIQLIQRADRAVRLTHRRPKRRKVVPPQKLIGTSLHRCDIKRRIDRTDSGARLLKIARASHQQP